MTSGASVLAKDPPVVVDLLLTLENILHGCTKNMKIERTITDEFGNKQGESETLLIEVKPGTEAGTKYKFPRKSDRCPDRIPADIVFIARDKPHDKFVRNGVNIEYSLDTNNRRTAFNVMPIPTLDGDNVPLLITDSNRSQTVRTIEGFGLPYPKDHTKRGELVIRIKKPDMFGIFLNL